MIRMKSYCFPNTSHNMERSEHLYLYNKHQQSALFAFSFCRFHPFLQATKALTESRDIALLCFQTSALEGGEGSSSRPDRFLPPGKTRYPLYRKLGGPQSQSGQVRKISAPPDFDPRTVQPVVSRYTD
jgi:hypothetical protein